MNIIIRTFNLLLFPDKEWKQIAAEANSRKKVYVRFVLPWLCLIAIATLIGTWLYTSREKYSAAYVFYLVTLLWTSISAGLYLSAFLITEIMAHRFGTKNHDQSFALMAYSSGAAYLTITIVALFPFFSELLVLAFYTCYLYWRGIPYLIQVEDQKQMIYGLLSFIIAVLVHLLMFFFFGNVLKSILV